MPGITNDHISAKIKGNLLSIRGERCNTYDTDKTTHWFYESDRGTHERVVALPVDAIEDSAKASIRNGLVKYVLRTAEV